MPASLPLLLLTNDGNLDARDGNPQGKAPVWSPCGIGGGDPRGCFDGSFPPKPIPCPAGAVPNGPDARFFPFPDPKMTIW